MPEGREVGARCSHSLDAYSVGGTAAVPKRGTDMMLRVFLVGIVCAACASACNSVSKADFRPGGNVWTEDKSISWLPVISGNPGRDGWVFVRVIAPAGATECSADGSWLDGRNPYPSAPVAADGEAMITVRNEASEVSVSCATPGGSVQRKVSSERVISTTHIGQWAQKHDYFVVPPLVHLDPADPQAAARWDALRLELCPADMISAISACTGDRMSNMKRRDLNEYP
jgi:hypothetical protein